MSNRHRGLIGSGILALMIANTNHLGRLADDEVTPIVTWLLPLLVLLGILLCGVCGVVLLLYCQNKLGASLRKCCPCCNSLVALRTREYTRKMHDLAIHKSDAIGVIQMI